MAKAALDNADTASWATWIHPHQSSGGMQRMKRTSPKYIMCTHSYTHRNAKTRQKLDMCRTNRERRTANTEYIPHLHKRNVRINILHQSKQNSCRGSVAPVSSTMPRTVAVLVPATTKKPQAIDETRFNPKVSFPSWPFSTKKCQWLCGSHVVTPLTRHFLGNVTCARHVSRNQHSIH